jgi:hypothetical protein
MKSFKDIVQENEVNESTTSAVKQNRAIKSTITKALMDVKKAVKRYYGKTDSSGIGYLMDDTNITIDALLVEWEDADLTEMTVAGTGTGNFTPMMAMNSRLTSNGAMRSIFTQCADRMDRKQMLAQCRKLGLSLSHLSDDDLRKTLNGMSLRNKKQFIGA